MSYRSYTADELEKIVKKYSKVQAKTQKSARLLFVDQGARLLGLFPDPALPNVLWAHNDLDKAYARGSWLVGGERLWLAPERNYCYENPRDFTGVHVPTGIDPGSYERGDGLSYQNTFSLLDLWHNQPVDNCIMRRSFELLDDPYTTGLAYAGVSIADSVSVPSAEAVVALWSLSQTYTCGKSKPGTALFPIKKGGRILSYFNPIPAAFADVQNGYARFRIDSSRIFKFAIAPDDVAWANPCKDVYVSPYPSGTHWFLVAKRSDDLPRSQADCVDVARDNPEGPKGAIQSYNNGPEEGASVLHEFGEIELQLTKATLRGKKLEAAAKHELLAYAGTRKQILELAGTLLGIEGIPTIY
jgi:hypothetical protein